MKKKLDQLVMKSKSLIIMLRILNNLLIPPILKNYRIKRVWAEVTANMSVEQSVEEIDLMFNEYLLYSNLDTGDLRDKNVLEIGPGDNLGVALKFLISGANKVVSLDRFFLRQASKQQSQIYERMRSVLSESKKKLVDEAIKIENGSFHLTNDRFKYISGKSIGEALDLFGENSFDFIVSRAVLMCANDAEAAFYSMDKMLRKNGYLIHKIVLRDWQVFADTRMHPLTFLTTPDFIWKLMTYPSGGPNRKCIDYYRLKMKELHYQSKLLITRVVGSESDITPYKEKLQYNVDYDDSTLSMIEEIRPKLAKRFRPLSSEDLMISDIFLIAKKLV